MSGARRALARVLDSAAGLTRYEADGPAPILDIGALIGSLVGQSERDVRQVLRLADAMAPCVRRVDEVERGLVEGGGRCEQSVAAVKTQRGAGSHGSLLPSP